MPPPMFTVPLIVISLSFPHPPIQQPIRTVIHQHGKTMAPESSPLLRYRWINLTLPNQFDNACKKHVMSPWATVGKWNLCQILSEVRQTHLSYWLKLQAQWFGHLLKIRYTLQFVWYRDNRCSIPHQRQPSWLFIKLPQGHSSYQTRPVWDKGCDCGRSVWTEPNQIKHLSWQNSLVPTLKAKLHVKY